MMLLLLLSAVCVLGTTSAQYDASAEQLRDAYSGVGAPAPSLALPPLRNVSSLQPNTTFVIPNGTTAVESAGKFDYALALTLPWQYMKAERLGRLPADNGVPWRADSFLQDPVQNGIADAGDFLTCQFPLGQSLTLIALSIIEFGAGYSAAGATADALDALRWGCDFLVNSRVNDVETVVQVGNPDQDHSSWLPAEQSAKQEGTRPAYTVSPSVPGSDALGAMAGALAAAAIVYSDEDADYSRHLTANARDLYALATAFPGTYNSIQAAASIYYSSGFSDDLAFAAVLLHLKTNESHYLDDAQRYYAQVGQLSTYGFSWDSKGAGAALYLGLVLPSPANQPYLRDVSGYLDSWASGKNGVTITPKGFFHLSQWGALRYACSAATIAAIYAKRVPTDPNAQRYRQFVQTNVDNVLGNDGGYSYLIGFGEEYPRRAHNRGMRVLLVSRLFTVTHIRPTLVWRAGSSCNGPTAPCGYDVFNRDQPNPNLLTGAMVGGPDQNDQFRDSRDNYIQNEPGLDYVTALLTPLASLV